MLGLHSNFHASSGKQLGGPYLVSHAITDCMAAFFFTTLLLLLPCMKGSNKDVTLLKWQSTSERQLAMIEIHIATFIHLEGCNHLTTNAIAQSFFYQEIRSLFKHVQCKSILHHTSNACC